MYALDRKTAKLRNFESKKVANQNGNGFVLFENAEQLLENLNATGESSSLFVDAYNNHSDNEIALTNQEKMLWKSLLCRSLHRKKNEPLSKAR